MAKKDSSTLHVAVEKQSAACRTLATAMRASAGSMGRWLHGSERKLIEQWADMVDEIGRSLTEALAENDKGRLQRFWKVAAVVAAPIAALGVGATTGVGEGVGSQAFEYFMGEDPVTNCAAEIISNAQAYEAEVEGAALPQYAVPARQLTDQQQRQLPIELKRFRDRHGLTQDDLAKQLRTHRRTISGWEHGRTPNVEQQDRLARLLWPEDEALR